MNAINIIEQSPGRAIERMQVLREKIHLDFATHEEIEELNDLENILMDSVSVFQSEFWA